MVKDKNEDVTSKCKKITEQKLHRASQWPLQPSDMDINTPSVSQGGSETLVSPWHSLCVKIVHLLVLRCPVHSSKLRSAFNFWPAFCHSSALPCPTSQPYFLLCRFPCSTKIYFRKLLTLLLRSHWCTAVVLDSFLLDWLRYFLHPESSSWLSFIFWYAC